MAWEWQLGTRRTPVCLQTQGFKGRGRETVTTGEACGEMGIFTQVSVRARRGRSAQRRG